MAIIESLKPVSELGFGQYFCPLYVQSSYENGSWSEPELLPYRGISLDPAAKVFHYGQEIFEGMKIFRHPNGTTKLFRPRANIARMARSAEILAMPSFPEELFLKSIYLLAARTKSFVPPEPGALYLRPTMIGTSPTLGVSPSKDYLFYILASPVGGYFANSGDEGSPAVVSLWVALDHVRAVRGGLGEAKTGANYAASLLAVSEAKKRGFGNVLFLDAIKREFLEELSGMNIFIVEDGILKTPRLGDTILRGITRDSILKLAQNEKIPTEECDISIHKVVEGLNSGRVTEVFACGTGASLTSVGELGWKDEKILVGNGKAGKISTRLFKLLCGVQFGLIPSPIEGWLEDC